MVLWSFPKASIILAATCYQPRYQTLPIYLTGNTYTFAICSMKLLTYLLTYLVENTSHLSSSAYALKITQTYALRVMSPDNRSSPQ